MSVEQVSVPLMRVNSLQVGSMRKEDVDVGVFDTSKFPPVLQDIAGLISLKFFEETPFTIDFPSQTLLIGGNSYEQGERQQSLQVPLELARDGPSNSAFIELELPSGDRARVEVDTGSDTLILNTRYMGALGIRSEEARQVRGNDETGRDYIRYFSRIRGEVSLPGQERFAQADPEVIFQDIINDGLVRVSFLKRFAVTFDTPNSRMIFFAKP